MNINLSNGVFGGTMCLSKAGLTEGTNSATLEIAAPNGAGVDYAIDGILYHKADADNIAMTALDQQADDTTCLYLVALNSSGTLSIVKGTEALTEDIANGDANVEWPRPASGTCPIGGFKIVLDGTTFTSGTTDLGAANVTDTFYDFMTVPPQGISS